MKWMIIIAVLAVVVGLIIAGCAVFRGSYESAPYKVVRTDGHFQVRDYPVLVVVQTPRRDADDSFMKLFRFIGGQNAIKQKIAMTTPVFMAGAATNATMSFVMPKSMHAEQVPQPTEPGVTVTSLPAARVAVLRFSGGRSAHNESKALARLTDWMKKEKLTPAGDPMFGYFDPPWTPPLLRRNEVMIAISPAS